MTEPLQGTSCPPPQGEFPPTDCAIVRGRALDPHGHPLSDLGVRVDSMVRGLGYAYASGGAATDAQGRFDLVVFRINRFRPPATPDTSTVEIKAYHTRMPTPGSAPAASAPVRLRFAPLGEAVELSEVEVTFVLP